MIKKASDQSMENTYILVHKEKQMTEEDIHYFRDQCK